MQRARAPVDGLRDLLSECWKDACFAVEGSYSKFVNDAGVIRRTLLEHDRQLVHQGSRPQYMADAFLCMLCESSARSQSENVSSFAAAAALAAGVISPQQFMQLVERRTTFSRADLVVAVLELVPALRETLQPLIVQFVERDCPAGPDYAQAIVVKFGRLLNLLDAPVCSRLIAPVSAWIEAGWRAWLRLAEGDRAAARSFDKDYQSLASAWHFGCIRPLLEPREARSLAALYVEASQRTVRSFKDQFPRDLVALIPALPSEIQVELLDVWFDDAREGHLLEAAGALAEMDSELPSSLKQDYGCRLARRLERRGESLEWRVNQLLILALRWCGQEDAALLRQQLSPFVKRLLLDRRSDFRPQVSSCSCPRPCATRPPQCS
jgi:hypothetical protein